MQLKHHTDITSGDLGRIETPFFARDLVEDALSGLAMVPVFGLRDILNEQFPDRQNPGQDPFVVDQLLAQIDDAQLLLLHNNGERPFVPLFQKQEDEQAPGQWQLNEPLSPQARFNAEGLLRLPIKVNGTGQASTPAEPFSESRKQGSWLDHVNDRWAATEKESEVFSLTMGRQSLPGSIHTATTGIQEIISASRGLSYIKRPGYLSDVVHVMKSQRTDGYAYVIIDADSASHTKPAVKIKYTENSNKGHYQIWKDSRILKHTAKNVKNAASSGAAWALPLSVAGTTLQYAIDDDKDFYSKAFAKDVGLDTAKGLVSGAAGGAATTGAIVAYTAFYGGTVGSVVPGVGTAIGLIVGATVGYIVAYRVEDIYQTFGWR